MPTIIDALMVTLGLDPAGMKKGAADADKVRKKLESDEKKSNKKLSDDEKKLEDERKKNAKQQELRNKALVSGLNKARNEALKLAALFTAGVGIKNFVANTIDTAASLGFLSDNLDMSVEKIQAYQRASERAGGTAEGMTAQLKESAAEIARLRTGQGPSEGMQAAFRGAGMAGTTLSESDLKNGNAYLLARSRIVSELYKKNAQNAALMASQMGISEDQFNLIKQGPAAILKLVAAQEKNSAISRNDSRQALELKNRWLDFVNSMQVTSTKLLVGLIPMFKQLLKLGQRLSDFLMENSKDLTAWLNSIDFKKIGDEIERLNWKEMGRDLLAVAHAFGEVARGVMWVVDALSKLNNPSERDWLKSKESERDVPYFGANGQFAKMFSREDVPQTGVPKTQAERDAPYFGTNGQFARMFSSMFSGVGASSAQPAGARTSTTTSDVKIGKIEVHTQATDAPGIAKSLGGAVTRYSFAPQANTGM